MLVSLPLPRFLVFGHQEFLALVDILDQRFLDHNIKRWLFVLVEQLLPYCVRANSDVEAARFLPGSRNRMPCVASTWSDVSMMVSTWSALRISIGA